MTDTYRAVIPYESMDPLAIGATDDESKKHRDTLELEIPDRQPDRRRLPGRAGAGRRRDRGGAPRRSPRPSTARRSRSCSPGSRASRS